MADKAIKAGIGLFVGAIIDAVLEDYGFSSNIAKIAGTVAGTLI